MRALILFTALGALAACAPQVPDSGYSSAEAGAARDMALNTGAIAPPPMISGSDLPPLDATAGATDGATDGTFTPAPVSPGSFASASSSNVAGSDVGGSDIAADAAAALAATSPGAVPGAQAAPAASSQTIQPAAAPLPEAVAPSGLSSENDFGAVSDARTIEDDAARMAQNRQQYQVIQPQALPEREGGSGPNIVTYALQTTHPRGTQVYSRSGINLAGRAQRNCAKYPSADQAQIDFLANGGPERDRMSLDPDGDGYACSWNPAPFRNAAASKSSAAPAATE